MGSFRSDEDVITVLSIDGGGVRCIIPAKILESLETEIKKLEKGRDESQVRIADYFNVIAGSGTGSIVAALLAAPESPPPQPSLDEKNQQSQSRPAAMPDILKFLEDLCRTAFSKDSYPGSLDDSKKKGLIGYLKGTTLGRLLFKPKIGGQILKKKIEDRLNGVTLDSLSNGVVIPAFNVDVTRPCVFSTAQAKELKRLEYNDIKLSDVVLGSSASPTIFPIHAFEFKGKTTQFADGGLVSNNPTMLALQEAALMNRSNSKTKSKEIKYVVLSLGTIRSSITPRGNRSLLKLLFGLLLLPSTVYCEFKPRIVQFVHNLCSDIVDIYMTRFLQSPLLNKTKTDIFLLPRKSLDDYSIPLDTHLYLRIQEYKAEVTSLPSITDGKAIDILKKRAKNMWEQTYTTINPVDGVHTEPQKDVHNKDALETLAKVLVQLRRKRDPPAASPQKRAPSRVRP